MNKSNFDITNLQNSINTLKECSLAYKNNSDLKIQGFIEDSCVKRFEYTVETSWKIMKKYLKEFYGKTDKELTMNNIFRLMEGFGFIKSWENWRFYYEKRNDTSHEYNKEKTSMIFETMDNLIIDAEFLFNELSKDLNK